MNHKVNKILLELPANDYEQAVENQRLAKHWASHTLPIILEKNFNSITKNKEVLYLEKLEINLSDLPWQVQEAELERQILAQLKNLETSKTQIELVQNQWIKYLESGVSFTQNIFIKSIDYEPFIAKYFDDFFEAFLKNLLEKTPNITILQRLWAFQSNDLIIQFLQKLLNIQKEKADKIFLKLQSLKSKNPLVFWQIQQELFFAKSTNNQLFIVDFLEKIEKGNFEQIFEKIANKTENKLPNKIESSPPYSKGVILENAGLVLLFPFHKQFFETIGLIENSLFTNKKNQELAAQVLFYLATNESNSKDSEYLMPKILTGISMDEVLVFEAELPKYIKDEAADLLDSVREHWAELKNSSNQALQESFLQRNGILSIDGKEYTIKMEESGVDILLGKVPWGFRYFKLPWLGCTFITEWY